MNRYTGRIVLGMALAVAAKMLATGALAAVQAQQTQPAAQTGKQETIPDAPSAVKPPTPSFPANIKPEPVYQPNHPSETTTAVDSTSVPAPAPAGAEAAPAAETTPPPPDVQAMPSAKTKPESETSSLDDFRITKIVNFVTVPVTVKDRDGHIVDGLQRKDFSVYEDNVLQNLSLFTSDPFPMSAAVVIDVGMADKALSKVNQTLPSITGAFSQYDEVAVYTYGNTVSNVTDFRAANERLTEAMRLAKRSGRQGGVPVVSGPMAVGPTVSGHPLDPSTPRVNTVIKESRVLNDALLQAALDLSRRERARRRVIFLISDGKEDGSKASYNAVLKVLLTHEISVYALGTDSAALPFYGTVSRASIPFQGKGNILPKYVSATGGELLTEMGREGIERAYAQLTGEARNQYTLGYSTKGGASSSYRNIEVRVKRPGLKVYARDGYYPLPRPQNQTTPAKQ